MVHQDLFTFAQKADYWNDLYAAPASLFEHNMLLRRDYAADYITSHFATGASVLDLGCGAGVLSEKLIEKGYAVTAADNSQDMLDLSAKRLGRFPEQSYRLFRANCLNLPFADRSFDLVVCLGMFGYFDEVTQALREIRRVLRPGGMLIISVRNFYTPILFDVVALARQPFRLVKQLFRRLIGRPRQAADHPPSGETGTKTAGPEDDFRIHIYERPAHLIAGVSKRGYTLIQFDGFGYGPLKFADHQVIAPRPSIRISDFLNRFFRTARLNGMSRWVADVSFFAFQRDA